MTIVGLLGASGFLGQRVARALVGRGATVHPVPAPRLSTGGRDLEALLADLQSPGSQRERDRLADELAGCGAVVNAAGRADATASGDELFGADALLPGVVAAATPDPARFVHVSSAAVQGRIAMLDEAGVHHPFSPYSQAKSLGERLASAVNERTVCFRPTSVHGPGRPVTQQLVRVLASPLASVAGRGDRPTPQVLVQNVADACAFLALVDEQPPSVVLHPSEGLTTAELVRLLGGREPRRIPTPAARVVVGAGRVVGRWSAPAAGVARRLELLWFGQSQQRGWLDGRWTAPAGRQAWKEAAWKEAAWKELA